MNWWKCVVTRTLAKPERRSAYNMDENVLYTFFLYMIKCWIAAVVVNYLK